MQKCIDSISQQSLLPDELIIVDDASSDDSLKKIKNLTKGMICPVQIIHHKENKGLAASYNTGIAHAHGDIIITMHQDAQIRDTTGIEILVKPFEDPGVVTTGHTEIIPYSNWKLYPFWLKASTSRHVGVYSAGINGKFDAYRKKALCQVGLFDSKRYRTAGEDGDMVFRLRSVGIIIQTKATVIHMHSLDFSLKDYIRKHAQLAEAQGVNLRRGRIRSTRELIRVLFREIILVLILLPFTQPLGWGILIIFSLLYTKNLYQQEARNIRLLVVPFVNIYTIIIDAFYLSRGFLQGKQTM